VQVAQPHHFRQMYHEICYVDERVLTQEKSSKHTSVPQVTRTTLIAFSFMSSAILCDSQTTSLYLDAQYDWDHQSLLTQETPHKT